MTHKTPCHCQSGNAYADCCQPFHDGNLPDTALKLMRSRYSAYALCLPAYIIHTTHPDNPQFCHDTVRWSEEILKFCTNTKFNNLEILHFQENGPHATVTFVAYLTQSEKDISFTETSHFEKIKGKWLYLSGKLSEDSRRKSLT